MGLFSSWSRLEILSIFLLAGSLSPAAGTPAFAATVVPHDIQFTHGVASGDVTATGAVLWTRVDQPATVTLQIAKKPSMDVPDQGYAECMTDPVLALFQVNEFDNFGVTQFVNSNSYGYGLVDFDPATSQLTISLKNESGTPMSPDIIGGSKGQDLVLKPEP